MITAILRPKVQSAALGAIALVVLVLVAGCGSSSSSDTSSSSSSAKTPAATGPAALVPETIKKRGYLNVSGPDGSPPLSQKTGNQAVGMDPDLMNALGTVLGVKVRFSAVPFDSQLPGMAAGKYDVSTGEF